MPPRVVHKCTLISSAEDWLCSANADDVSSPNVRLRRLTGSRSHSTDSGPQCGAGHFPPTPPRRGIIDVPRVEDVDPTRKAECGDQLATHTACATCPHGSTTSRPPRRRVPASLFGCHVQVDCQQGRHGQHQARRFRSLRREPLRGHGDFARSVMKAQAACVPFTPVFAALVSKRCAGISR